MMEKDQYLDQIASFLSSQFELSKEQVREMMPSFIDTLEMHMCSIEGRVEEDDVEGLKKMGHKMKGALLNLGLDALADSALILENYGGVSVNNQTCTDLIASLRTEVDIIRK